MFDRSEKLSSIHDGEHSIWMRTPRRNFGSRKRETAAGGRGFRVVSIPEPSGYNLFLLALLVAASVDRQVSFESSFNNAPVRNKHPDVLIVP